MPSASAKRLAAGAALRLMRHLASARGRYFDAATAAGYERIDWQISSDDPRILAWSWEALVDPQAATLAHACRIERRLNQLRDPDPLSQDLLRDRINILLITARPWTTSSTIRFRGRWSN
jgi:hypothetical protein